MSVHAVRLVYLYEKDLKRAMGKLEDMFAENELRDDRIKELEVLVKDLNSAVETAASKADLSASSSREAILLSQIGDHHNSVGARIDYLERSCEDYVAREVARAVREAIMKYRERLERLRHHKAGLREYTDLLDNIDVAALDDYDLVLSPLPSLSQD
ncbi:hypothetical protein HID58_059954 [Brassica napus]|uniref:Uncharacterized protein n=1 Tax=Brassica napus TaxID=3708 RepID=A0ABQ7ZUM4_BRANA|nr:hypothetical protein HID58_059954 [Brassica napus]